MTSEVIHTWAAMAETLGVSESTLRRWHETHPLPIKQVGEGGRVMVRRDDLWAWFEVLPNSVTGFERR